METFHAAGIVLYRDEYNHIGSMDDFGNMTDFFRTGDGVIFFQLHQCDQA